MPPVDPQLALQCLSGKNSPLCQRVEFVHQWQRRRVCVHGVFQGLSNLVLTLVLSTGTFAFILAAHLLFSFFFFLEPASPGLSIGELSDSCICVGLEDVCLGARMFLWSFFSLSHRARCPAVAVDSPLVQLFVRLVLTDRPLSPAPPSPPSPPPLSHLTPKSHVALGRFSAFGRFSSILSICASLKFHHRGRFLGQAQIIGVY